MCLFLQQADVLMKSHMGCLGIYLCSLLKKRLFGNQILSSYIAFKMQRCLQIVFSLVYDPNYLSNCYLFV